MKINIPIDWITTPFRKKLCYNDCCPCSVINIALYVIQWMEQIYHIFYYCHNLLVETVYVFLIPTTTYFSKSSLKSYSQKCVLFIILLNYIYYLLHITAFTRCIFLKSILIYLSSTLVLLFKLGKLYIIPLKTLVQLSEMIAMFICLVYLN